MLKERPPIFVVLATIVLLIVLFIAIFAFDIKSIIALIILALFMMLAAVVRNEHGHL